MSTSDYKLPLNLKPLHYDITIKTDLKELVFSGKIQVDLSVEEDTSVVVFNASKINLSDFQFIDLETKYTFTPTIVNHNADQERASLVLPTTLKTGSRVRLSAVFDAKLIDDMMGYYRAVWKRNEKEECYSLTQFQPTAARRAFPCWDEPLLKATYDIKMISRTDTVNLSNMPAISEEPYTADSNLSGEWKITTFETTPLISSYLVAYANGPFEYIERMCTSSLTGKTIPLRIYATPDCVHQAHFALDIKAKVLPLYEELFDIPYPLPKLDTLVVTNFDGGAMENWGLITGRTEMFLMDPKKVGITLQKRIAKTQSHEVAHM